MHYREYAVDHGVLEEDVIVEPRATNTDENFEFTRDLLIERGTPVGSMVVMSRPYQQRGAYATCKKVWPEVEVVCASNPMSLDEYVRSIGDVRRVIDMLRKLPCSPCRYLRRTGASPLHHTG